MFQQSYAFIGICNGTTNEVISKEKCTLWEIYTKIREKIVLGLSKLQ